MSLWSSDPEKPADRGSNPRAPTIANFACAKFDQGSRIHNSKKFELLNGHFLGGIPFKRALKVGFL
ncbi:hypothetical protein TEU_01585 [Thermococcus eurythermalis]|uniref:Uncharacterized protein n=1 Tax=Thermococcus eurythermalis TaxID=1505907 RepID=A0A097QRM2_9EURY|nr:hypothetical protein TEU_01585 [Thermococcus eurythermalis]